MKINYLNNKDILKEIHKSKTTYCSFTKPEYADYDMIIDSVKRINKKNILQAKKNRADRLSRLAFEAAQEKSSEKLKLDQFEIKHTKIANTDVVFRVMTWEHIPVDESKAKKQLIEDQEDVGTEYDDSDSGVTKYVKVNFPPFFHYKIDDNDEPVIIGKSHWLGSIDQGHFSKDHGTMTKKLAIMFMKLCERYATRSNWRGYCIDELTQALTQRGWVSHDEITENDTILSFNGSNLAWSAIKSIFRDNNFDGLMHYLTTRGIDSLITPQHKIVTDKGLIPVELLKESDRVIVMGDKEPGAKTKTYSDALVELMGWIVTEGNYDVDKDNNIRNIRVYQNRGKKANRIRNCLTALNFKFTETKDHNISFNISRENSRQLVKLAPEKNLTMEFILALTANQRDLLVNTMINGDGWKRGANLSYVQKSKTHMDMFQVLVTLTGKKSNIHYIENHRSFGKLVDFYTMNIFSKRGNTTRGECIDMHGGKDNGRESGMTGKGKINHPNKPTTQYKGTVWCPETEYGCFVARRNGKVYLTGNTYNDEMRSQALLQLSQIGLQFDESKSANPFAYYTAAITNSFTRVLNIEKRNQNLRDDILEINNLNPSYTRQNMNAGGYSYDE